MNRRRFLTISACCLASPSFARPVTWRGYALGAEVSLTFNADKTLAEQAIQAVERSLKDVESAFSLYNPQSEISRLNQSKSIEPSIYFFDLMQIAGQIRTQTERLFDPTVQSIWRSKNPTFTSTWDDIEISTASITLPKNCSITLNGIAQGYATDIIHRDLRELGFQDVLINIGEFYAKGGPWTLGIADPKWGLIRSVELSNQAIATSSPYAMMLDKNTGHIINPINGEKPYWSTVSVVAPTSVLADGLSTALTLMSASTIKAILPTLRTGVKIHCVSFTGETVTFAA